jgi:hypothetical protein
MNVVIILIVPIIPREKEVHLAMIVASAEALLMDERTIVVAIVAKAMSNRYSKHDNYMSIVEQPTWDPLLIL